MCDGRSHRAVECPSKASTSRNEPFGHGRRSYCFKCGAMGHKAQECKTALQRSHPGSRAGEGYGPGKNPIQAQRVACAMQVSRRSDGLEMETLELKSGEKIKVLNSACMAEIKYNLPVLSGKVVGTKVEVLRDTGCSGVIIRSELVDETDFTGEMGHIMTENRTIK